HVLPGDQPSAALICQVRPEPVDRHRRAVAEADQEVDVRHAPGQPGNAAGQPNSTEIDDRLATPDRRQIAEITVAERGGWGGLPRPARPRTAGADAGRRG